MDFPREFVTHSPKETAEVAGTLAAELTAEKGMGGELPHVICLYGPLGAGKTTFVQGFARGLGITGRLLSPTFIIVRRYGLGGPGFLYHIDLYRLHGIAQISDLGFSEMVGDPDSFVLIEWAERLGDRLPRRRLDVRLEETDDGGRKILVEKP